MISSDHIASTRKLTFEDEPFFLLTYEMESVHFRLLPDAIGGSVKWPLSTSTTDPEDEVARPLPFLLAEGSFVALAEVVALAEE